jgi:hypothetical protein
MRLPKAVLLLIGSLALSGCVASSQSPPVRWTAGFWFWDGSSLDPACSGDTVDVLFAQVGTIRSDSDRRAASGHAERWNTYGRWPDEMPAARDYWLVYRYERQGVPGEPAAEQLAGEIVGLLEQARERNLHVAGIQLDIDSPTSALPRYAEFLKEVRKNLPAGFGLSITALLDWFRGGTAIDDVIRQVDEFVPQFYDLADPAVFHGEGAIAARIDAANWGPVFNRFHKRFRIGISSFGRVRLVPNSAPGKQGGDSRIAFYGDLQPLDIAANPAFELRAERNRAEETVLNYRATRKVSVAYTRVTPGDTLQFIVSTPEAIRAAVQSAREIKGSNTGVVFFRWPAERESWAMQPDEVLDAAGAGTAGRTRQDRVHVVPGGCAAVECVDVYLESAGPLSPRVARYQIHASTELEYFLPEQKVPVRLEGTSDLEVTLPPYCGRGRLYLGRAVSLKRAEFTVEVTP